MEDVEGQGFKVIYKQKDRDMWDRIATILISLAITLSWFPGYITGVLYDKFGLTRWITVPLILISFLIEFKIYIAILIKPVIIGLVLATMIGMGGGVATGAVPIKTLLDFIPSLLIFVFYARKRDPKKCRNILISLLIGSWVLCIIITLAGFGLVPSEESVLIKDFYSGTFERTFAGVSTTLLGPWVAILVGLLGGSIFCQNGIKKMVLGPLSLLIVTFVTLITAQRAIALIAVLGSFMALIGIMIGGNQKTKRDNKIKNKIRYTKLSFIFFIIFSILLFMVTKQIISEKTFTLKYRFLAITISQDYATVQRLDMWSYFIKDLITKPMLIGQGQREFIEYVGTVPHLIIGEAYYNGGILMLAALVIIMVVGLDSMLNVSFRSDSIESIILGRGLLNILLLTSIYLMLNPGFITRIPYVLFGLAFGISGSTNKHH
jgi:hypothetical protein